MSKPFFTPSSRSKPTRTMEAVDVAARHLVYELFEATDGVQGAWHVLGKIGQRPATVSRAVERGWMITHATGKLVAGSLTSDGRLLARKALS
ncbi:MAG: hypothetical protein JO339_07150 [Alphaproteobacteria bacterium]|nr:hypothetical protein [Alphaproteobacteria bacterium]